MRRRPRAERALPLRPFQRHLPHVAKRLLNRRMRLYGDPPSDPPTEGDRTESKHIGEPEVEDDA